MQILIAEDDQASRETLKHMLQGLGHGVVETSDGLQAWEYIQKQEAPLLLLLDIMMPRISGLELCRKIRSSRMRASPYIIFVTAKTENEDIVQGLEAGGNDYILKPYNFDELRARLNVGQRMVQMQYELFREIDERKQAQEQLQEAYSKLDNLVELNADGIMVIDREGLVLFTNSAAAGMLGRSESELLNEKFGYPLNPGKNTEIELLTGSDRKTLVELRTQETQWDGRSALLTSFRDVTQRKKAEQELWKIKEERAAIYENAPLIMMVVDRGHRIRETNSLTADFFNLSLQELIGRQMGDLLGCSYYFHEQHECGSGSECKQCSLKNTIFDTFETGESHDQVEITSVLRQPEEKRKFTILVSTTLLVHRKEPVVLLTIIDITERKQTEKELIKMEQQSKSALKELQELVNSISSVLISLDNSCRIDRWNNAAEKHLGVSQEEAKGRFLYECPVSWEWERIESALEQSRQNHQVVSVEDVSYVAPGNVNGFFNIMVHPVFEESRDILTGFLILGTDITEKKLMQSQFLQEQKMDAIGQLAAGIAHEINTPIQYVDGNTSYLQDVFQDILDLLNSHSRLLELAEREQFRPGVVDEIKHKMQSIDMDFLLEDVPNSLNESLEGLHQVARIVQSMKNFAHPGEKDYTYIDINKALDDTITICKNEWKYFARLVRDYDPDLPYVSCLKDEVNQVFLNLIVNAAQAIGESGSSDGKELGTITVSTSYNTREAEVRISDTGPGIPEHIRERIFNPFFTTKEVAREAGKDCTWPTT